MLLYTIHVQVVPLCVCARARVRACTGVMHGSLSAGTQCSMFFSLNMLTVKTHTHKNHKNAHKPSGKQRRSINSRTPPQCLKTIHSLYAVYFPCIHMPKTRSVCPHTLLSYLLFLSSLSLSPRSPFPPFHSSPDPLLSSPLLLFLFPFHTTLSDARAPKAG